MESVAELKFSDEQKQILNSVMPGGENWHAYAESDDGDCLNTCPYFSRCRGNGPDKVCSESWSRAEPNPKVLGVIFHVLNNFEHYNRGDIEIPKRSRALAGIRFAIS